MFEAKIQPEHLQRNAYIYVRQSTLRQMVENSESTKRQYDLRERANAMGWDPERTIVVDEDLGLSGSSAKWRDGFQYLIAEVTMAKAGAVFALEVSRLARSSADWHRLLEICAMTDTLIVDEDGVYDPRHFNDRFLLGMKGQLSEAELHMLKARLQGGALNKAQRGALQLRLPIGLCYSPGGKIILDPDKEIQTAVRRIFEVFAQKGSAGKVVQYFSDNKLFFPHRIAQGVNKGDICWMSLKHSCVLRTLHNPRYTGAYIFGRMRVRKNPATGKLIITKMDKKDWKVFIPEHGEGYITWEEFETNQRRLRANAVAYGADRRSGPPREGPALLQGIVVCGKCGKRMTVRYHERKGGLIPDYVCQRDGIENNSGPCQCIPGGNIDETIGNLLIEKLTPESIEIALDVFEEVKRKRQTIKKAHKMRIAKLQYEAELAQRQYMLVDPSNRLVACTLEKNWNDKLLQLQIARDNYNQQYKNSGLVLKPNIKNQLLQLIKDFPGVWHNAKTPQRERKRIVRLMIKDVTLVKDKKITLKIRWHGGAHTIKKITIPLLSVAARSTPKETIARIRQLSMKCTPKQIVQILNREGYVTGTEQKFTVKKLHFLIGKCKIKSYYNHLREKGKLTVKEMAQKLQISPQTVIRWYKFGLLKGYVTNGKGEYLFNAPEDVWPVKKRGERLDIRKQNIKNDPINLQEV